MGLLKKMKYGVTGFTLGAIFFGGIAFGATSKIEVSFDPVKFIVNNVDKTPANGKFSNNGTSVPASLSYNGTIYVPLKMVGSMVDKKVDWDAKNKAALIGESAKERVYLTDLSPSKTDYMITNIKVAIGGENYNKSFMPGYTGGTGTENSQSYKLNGEYKMLTFSFGAIDKATSGDTNKISIYGDGKELWSGIGVAGVPMHDAKISVSGVQELEVMIIGRPDSAIVNPILTQ